MSNREHALAFARSTGWASRLPPKLQADLLDVARLRVVSEGTWLYGIDDPPGGIFGIVSGCLAAEVAYSGIAPQTLLLVHPGTWSGAGPVAGLEARIAGFYAKRPAEVLFIEVSDFRRVAEEHPEAWRHLSLLVLENLGQVIGLAQDLMVRNGRQRLRAILARLAGLHAELVPGHPTVYATQAEVADIANLSRSVVSRFLQEMERDGILRLGWGAIEILNSQRLKQGTVALG
jgi:CRP-like cAMP-binding protein